MLVSSLIGLKTKVKEQTGSAMASAAAIIAILAILAASMSAITVNEMVQIIQYQNSTRAYYVAESGVAQALWELNNWDAGANDGNVGTQASPIGINVGNQAGSYYTLFDRNAEVLRSYGTVGGATKRISVKVKFNRYQFVEEFDNKDFMDSVETQEYKGPGDEGRVRWGYNPSISPTKEGGIPSQLTLKFDPTDQPYDQENPDVAVNSQGEIYVVWQDNRHANWDIYIRKLREIDGELVDLWSQAGLRVNRDPETSTADQTNPRLVLDEQGNAFVVWQDNRNGNWDIYAAQIDSESAGRYWDFRVNSGTNPQIQKNQENPDITYSSSYVYVVWEDYRNNPGGSPNPRDIYAQKLKLSDGTKEWTGDTWIDHANQQVGHPAIYTDGSGNLYFAWEDKRNGSFDIYAQKTDSNGTFLWKDGSGSPTDARVSSVSGGDDEDYNDINNIEPRVVADDSGNTYFTWERWFDPDDEPPYPNLFVQKLSASKVRQWNNGWDLEIAHCENPDIVLTSAGGQSYLYVPHDACTDRVNWGEDKDIYAEKLNPNASDTNGNGKIDESEVMYWPLKDWTEPPSFRVDRDLATVETNQIMPEVAADSSGHLYYVWQDNRNGDWDVYGQKYTILPGSNDDTSYWGSDVELSSEGGRYVDDGWAYSSNVNTETDKNIVKYRLHARVFSRGSGVTFSVSANNGGNWNGGGVAEVKAEEETAFTMGDADGSYFNVSDTQLIWNARLDKTNDNPSLPYNEERSPAVDWIKITYWAGASPDYSTWRSN